MLTGIWQDNRQYNIRYRIVLTRPTLALEVCLAAELRRILHDPNKYRFFNSGFSGLTLNNPSVD